MGVFCGYPRYQLTVGTDSLIEGYHVLWDLFGKFQRGWESL